MDVKVEHGKIDSDFELNADEKLILHGMSLGSAVLKKGSELELHGIIAKNLFVENGAKAVIRGTVLGNVTNDGGDVVHYGIIKGALNRNSGKTDVKDGSLHN